MVFFLESFNFLLHLHLFCLTLLNDKNIPITTQEWIISKLLHYSIQTASHVQFIQTLSCATRMFASEDSFWICSRIVFFSSCSWLKLANSSLYFTLENNSHSAFTETWRKTIPQVIEYFILEHPRTHSCCTMSVFRFSFSLMDFSSLLIAADNCPSISFIFLCGIQHINNFFPGLIYVHTGVKQNM